MNGVVRAFPRQRSVRAALDVLPAKRRPFCEQVARQPQGEVTPLPLTRLSRALYVALTDAPQRWALQNIWRERFTDQCPSGPWPHDHSTR